jgi:CheY-like chemotaxis protein
MTISRSHSRQCLNAPCPGRSQSLSKARALLEQDDPLEPWVAESHQDILHRVEKTCIGDELKPDEWEAFRVARGLLSCGGRLWNRSQKGALMPPLKVLVIEDHTDTATLLQKVAELAGHTVRVCRTGFQAMKLAPSFRPDIILLDIGLPDMNGWNLARAFRNDFLLSSARIVAITGSQADADRLESKAAGIDAHLGKPIQYSEVLQALGTNNRQVTELLGASD